MLLRLRPLGHVPVAGHSAEQAKGVAVLWAQHARNGCMRAPDQREGLIRFPQGVQHPGHVSEGLRCVLAFLPMQRHAGLVKASSQWQRLLESTKAFKACFQLAGGSEGVRSIATQYPLPDLQLAPESRQVAIRPRHRTRRVRHELSCDISSSANNQSKVKSARFIYRPMLAPSWHVPCAYTWIFITII